MQTVIGISIFGITLAVGVIVLWVFLRKRKNEKPKTIIIQNGIETDSKSQWTKKGDFFGGIKDISGTYVIQGNARQVYRLKFTEITNGECYHVQFREHMGIGRAERVQGMEAFLSIKNDLRVSGFHCRIYAQNGKLYIEDANSRNHTILNGKRIDKPVPLKAGDEIRIGNTWMTVQF